MSLITFEQVQQATARCLDVHPPVDSVLPKECRLLVELLGGMIYTHSDAVESSKLATGVIEVLRYWGDLAGKRAPLLTPETV